MFSSHNNEKKREYAKAPRKSDTLKKIYIFLNMIDKIGAQINVHIRYTYVIGILTENSSRVNHISSIALQTH